jgi:hypothetical protein
VVVRQKQPVGRNEFARAAANYDDRILDADAVRVVKLRRLQLQPALCELIKWKRVDGVRQKHPFICQGAQRSNARKHEQSKNDC